MTSVLIDTDVLIEYLRGRLPARRFFDQLEGEPWLSSLTIAELWAGARPGADEEVLLKFALGFKIQPVTEALARRGGELRRKFGPSHGTGLVDAMVAAAAEHLGCPLVTFNSRHFPMLERVIIPYERP